VQSTFKQTTEVWPCRSRCTGWSWVSGTAATTLVLASLSGCGGYPASTPSASRFGRALTLTAELMPWELAAPISRAVVMAQGRSIIIAGGIGRSGASEPGVFRLNPRSGSLSLMGTLPAPVHDAGGALIGRGVFVFGGGSVSSSATVQAFTRQGGGRDVGSLPTPRSDLVASKSRGHVYLIGGYDGTRSLAPVLQTVDGQHFSVAGRLPVPVRYPAAAIASSDIFIFGGMRGNADTSTIQQVSLRSGRGRIVGHLPLPLSHASAFVLGGHVYIAGGRTLGRAVRRIWIFDPARDSVRPAGDLPMAISDAGVAVVAQSAYLVGGENHTPQASVVRLQLSSADKGGPGSNGFPFGGRLIIADRGNNRLLVVTPKKAVTWTYPSGSAPAPHGGFYFPDDAFFARRGSRIIVNQESNETIVQIAYPSGRVLWSYGHAHISGTAQGYLHEPDDAYLLKSGTVVVSDAQNCRVIFISPRHRVIRQIGTTGECVHQPPLLGSPNGDTPLANGNILISEINGSWMSEYSRMGRLMWTVHLPIVYPSDPQQIGPNRYLVADYSRPGGIYEFSRYGRILWSYQTASGPGMLDHPSLAERLPNGLIIVTDDYRDRIAIINPITKSIVWQYGHTDIASRAAGYLNTPDGFDLLSPIGRTPTHSGTG
jgi:Kelch motif